MWRCKDVARSLDRERHWKLPFLKRLAMWLHVLICPVCGRYHRDVIRSQEGARGLIEDEERDVGDATDEQALSETARRRIREALKRR